MSKTVRRVVIVLALSGIFLGMVFIPALLAQRRTQNPQNEPLRTLTLSGKGGARRMPPVRSGARPRSLTPAQKNTLFKGNTPKIAMKLSPARPLFSDKASLGFDYGRVYPSEDIAYFSGDPTTSRLYVSFETTPGRFYALDIAAHFYEDGTLTITNWHTNATQSIPVVISSSRVTASVVAESDFLRYIITSSSQWDFFSVEITEL